MRHSKPDQAVIFIGSLFSSPDIYASACERLSTRFGNTFHKSPSLPWKFSSYYDKELGSPIYRNFLFFDPIIDPVSLVDAKLAAGEIEEEFSVNGRRKINLDPGYMSLAKVVLSSRKNYSHRIYLGRGVFCELELFYQDGRFNALPYTYFDYRDDLFVDIFMKARGIFKKRLEGKAVGAD